MKRKTINITDQLYDYLLSVSLKETELQRELRADTAKQPQAIMQVGPDQGQLMAMLIRLMHAKKIIEIGVFTGYSSLCMAMALPDDGHIVACDINKEYTDIARQYWRKAGVADKIELVLAPAIRTLDKLLAQGEQGTYDFVFIDADKPEYPDYYERSLQLIRKGGLIAIDNVLWYGKPADPVEKDKDTLAIRKFNQKLYQDSRVMISMLTIADGLTLALKL
ncbi:MAG: SAM-dependent methyltransferase [Gammaproteobacteria bacterium RIFCSPLOWO2_12_47_11]|nr:MAG: SAM-dependent methyltransferase [Gammaproteobacteria bacterium RIFCSPLOWO2_12_47_11]